MGAAGLLPRTRPSLTSPMSGGVGEASSLTSRLRSLEQAELGISVEEAASPIPPRLTLTRHLARCPRRVARRSATPESRLTSAATGRARHTPVADLDQCLGHSERTSCGSARRHAYTAERERHAAEHHSANLRGVIVIADRDCLCLDSLDLFTGLASMQRMNGARRVCSAA